MTTEHYGKYYWCVKVTPDISPDGEIYLMADEVQVDSSGCLVLSGKSSANLILPATKWLACFAASLFDGHAVAVEHWKGEIAETGTTTTVTKSTSDQEERKSIECGKATRSIHPNLEGWENQI